MQDPSPGAQQSSFPAIPAHGEIIGVPMPPSLLAALDASIAALPEPRPSRAEAVLRMVGAWLHENGHALAGELRPEELNAENDV